MSEEEEKSTEKRKNNNESDSDDNGWVGPLPTEAVPVKKRKGNNNQQQTIVYKCINFETEKCCHTVLHHEKLYLENLPDSECYEKSYMHRDVITHIVVTKTDFVVTASLDGHVKFWKKMEEGIEFVKHFRSHLGKTQSQILNFRISVMYMWFFLFWIFPVAINALAANANGTYLCTASADKSIKVFDVINFDMINMIKISYVPQCAEWVSSPGDAIASLAM